VREAFAAVTIGIFATTAQHGDSVQTKSKQRTNYWATVVVFYPHPNPPPQAMEGDNTKFMFTKEHVFNKETISAV